MRIAATPRIFIQTPDIAEAKLFASWLNDLEVVRYSEQRHKTHTKESQLDYWLSPATAAPNGVYTIYLANIGKPIGSVSYQIDKPNNVANLGIMIGDKTEWGKGYGFEAWSATINYLFRGLKVRKVEAGCMLGNTAMTRLCHKYGMQFEGKRYYHFIGPDYTDDMIMFGVFPS